MQVVEQDIGVAKHGQASQHGRSEGCGRIEDNPCIELDPYKSMLGDLDRGTENTCLSTTSEGDAAH